MNLKSLFAGALPPETYGEGVRRRVRTAGVIWLLALVSFALTYLVYSLSSSVWATLGVAMLCGLASSKADIRFDPVAGEAPKQSEKLVWLILFVPALVLLGAVSIYGALNAHDGFDIFKVGLTAGLFGWVLGLSVVLVLGADSRAHA